MNDSDVAAYRLKCLHEWQEFYNMTPRDDSRLTQRFVSGELMWPVDVVARELMATDFIFQNTLYGEVIEEYMRRMADRLRAKHDLTWTDTWNIVRFYGPLSLKLLMLLECNAHIPDKL